MRLRSILMIALRSLNRNKMRSFLTMLGVIIGVAAVITMLAVGQGARDMIKSQIAAPGHQRHPYFSRIIYPGRRAHGSGKRVASHRRRCRRH